MAASVRTCKGAPDKRQQKVGKSLCNGRQFVGEIRGMGSDGVDWVDQQQGYQRLSVSFRLGPILTESKLQEAALYALANLAKENSAVTLALTKHSPDKDGMLLF